MAVSGESPAEKLKTVGMFRREEVVEQEGQEEEKEGEGEEEEGSRGKVPKDAVPVTRTDTRLSVACCFRCSM